MKRKIRNAKLGAHQARRARVARRIAHSDRARITVFRSARHIYAQLVDASGKTLGAVSTRSGAVAGSGATGNIEAAKKVGAAIAELAKQKGSHGSTRRTPPYPDRTTPSGAAVAAL